MTTYQEPLQSRRAARQGERNAAYGQQPEQAPEPLTYATQNRPPLPQYDGPDFTARPTPEASTGEPEESATQMLPEQDVPSYRPRDYSPEGHRALPSEARRDDGQIEYHTQSRSAVPAVPEAPAAEPTTAVPAVSTEHTLTRRELRALREAQGSDVNAPAAPFPVAPAPVVFTPAAVVPAPVVPEVSVFAPAEPEAAPEAAAVPSAPELSPFEALFAAPSIPQSVEDFAPDPISAAPVPAESVVAEPVAEAPVLAEPATTTEPEAAAELVEPKATAPSGHWSTQAELDDATQVNESTISRNVGAGSGAITTSALVLPSLPNPEFSQLGTGEILVTGSIGLPHSLATSGAHPQQLDEHHLDHELDPGDHQVVSTDSQPVRAVKAVSSHSSTRDVIVAKKPVGNRALTALIISAAAMAAVVVTLLVVGLVTNVL